MHTACLPVFRARQGQRGGAQKWTLLLLPGSSHPSAFDEPAGAGAVSGGCELQHVLPSHGLVLFMA